jgi:hypothetical protein
MKLIELAGRQLFRNDQLIEYDRVENAQSPWLADTHVTVTVENRYIY